MTDITYTNLQPVLPANADGTAYFADKTFSNAILNNLMDMTWFMWNYGNAFCIPLGLLIAYQTARLTYLGFKDFGGVDLIGWLYVYSF
jgi:hypothetical protein